MFLLWTIHQGPSRGGEGGVSALLRPDLPSYPTAGDGQMRATWRNTADHALPWPFPLDILYSPNNSGEMNENIFSVEKKKATT